MLTSRALAFAEIGKLIQSVNQYPINNSSILDKIRLLLSQETGRLERVFDVSFNLNSETLKGKADQRISLSRSKTYEFSIALGKISYKLINSAQFGEVDNDWSDDLEFAIKFGQILDCRPGNVQCGGKCQPGTFQCNNDASPAQKKTISSLIGAAKKEIRSIVTTGKGREFDIKPALETGVVTAVGAVTPKPIAPIASGAALVGMRVWRLSYDEVSKSGVQGLFDGFKSMSPEDKQKMYADGMTKVASVAAGKLGGALAVGRVPDIVVPLTELNVSGAAAGTGAGVSASRVVNPATRSIARKLVKG